MPSRPAPFFLAHLLSPVHQLHKLHHAHFLIHPAGKVNLRFRARQDIFLQKQTETTQACFISFCRGFLTRSEASILVADTDESQKLNSYAQRKNIVQLFKFFYIMMDIFKLLPYNWHYWLILHFGKPKTGYDASCNQFKYYELHNWIACPHKQIIHSNVWETYLRWVQKISDALDKISR